MGSPGANSQLIVHIVGTRELDTSSLSLLQECGWRRIEITFHFISITFLINNALVKLMLQATIQGQQKYRSRQCQPPVPDGVLRLIVWCGKLVCYHTPSNEASVHWSSSESYQCTHCTVVAVVVRHHRQDRRRLFLQSCCLAVGQSTKMKIHQHQENGRKQMTNECCLPLHPSSI